MLNCGEKASCCEKHKQYASRTNAPFSTGLDPCVVSDPEDSIDEGQLSELGRPAIARETMRCSSIAAGCHHVGQIHDSASLMSLEAMQGALYASNASPDSPAMLVYRPFEAWAPNSNWSLPLPDTERPMCLAAGRSLLALATSNNTLRLFSPAGQSAPAIAQLSATYTNLVDRALLGSQSLLLWLWGQTWHLTPSGYSMATALTLANACLLQHYRLLKHALQA